MRSGTCRLKKHTNTSEPEELARCKQRFKSTPRDGISDQTSELYLVNLNRRMPRSACCCIEQTPRCQIPSKSSQLSSLAGATVICTSKLPGHRTQAPCRRGLLAHCVCECIVPLFEHVSRRVGVNIFRVLMEHPLERQCREAALIDRLATVFHPRQVDSVHVTDFFELVRFGRARLAQVDILAALIAIRQRCISVLGAR